MRIYPLNSSKEGLEAQRLAFSEPESYVLKPQREGGGNNIYRSSIPKFLASLPNESSYGAYILMELIHSQKSRNSLLRDGTVVTGDVISELGVFGTVLWDSESGEVFENEEAGWLLRTKLSNSDEGGVLAGFGYLDSICLV